MHPCTLHSAHYCALQNSFFGNSHTCSFQRIRHWCPTLKTRILFFCAFAFAKSLIISLMFIPAAVLCTRDRTARFLSLIWPTDFLMYYITFNIYMTFQHSRNLQKAHKKWIHYVFGKTDTYWTVHHCVNWRIKNQPDATYYFIVLRTGWTCFGHYYAHHQELATMTSITTLVVSFLVCCRLEISCG